MTAHQDLSSRVRGSILALQGRQAVMMLASLGVGIVLSRQLDPVVFGIFGIATFCLSVITTAMDFGLAGALVQRKEEFDDYEISVAFTLQLAISILGAALVWILAPLTLHIYQKAPPELVWIIRSLTVPMVISPIGTVARLQLEREIQFQKIATIDVVTMIANNAVLLGMVFLGYGVWSFVWGSVAGALATTVVSLAMIRTKPRLAMNIAMAKKFFKFGVGFQFTFIANNAAGWIIPLISGAFLGPRAVGLLTWASSNGRRPLMVVDNVMRVAFPHFSRLQDNKAELGNQIELYITRLLIVCFGWGTLAVLLGSQMTHIVYTDKWLPAVLCLQLFAAGLAPDVLNWVGGMSLLALGRVNDAAKWTVVKSVISIAGAVTLVHFMGIVGIPLAAIAGSTISGVGIFIQLRKQVPLRLGIMLKSAIPHVFFLLAYLPLLAATSPIRTIGEWVLGTVVILWTSYKLVKELKPSLLSRTRVPT